MTAKIIQLFSNAPPQEATLPKSAQGLREKEDTQVEASIRRYIPSIGNVRATAQFLFMKMMARPVIYTLARMEKKHPYVLFNGAIVYMSIGIHEYYFNNHYLISRQDAKIHIPSRNECVDILEKERLKPKTVAFNDTEMSFEELLISAINETAHGKYTVHNISEVINLLRNIPNTRVYSVIELFCMIIGKYEDELTEAHKTEAKA